NTLYITDEASSTVVWRLLKNATTATVIAGIKDSKGSSNTQLNYPQGVYVDTIGTIGSTVGSTIAGITKTRGSSLNQFSGPRLIALDPTQTYIYIADGNNNRIMRYSTTSTSGDDGTVVAGGNGAGNTNTSLNHPCGIWCQPPVSSDLFITNCFGHSVIRWTPGASSGTFIAGTPGTAGSNSTLLNNPMGIKLDKYLNMFVADQGNHRIQMFCANNQTGITIVGTGVSGNTTTTLNGPRGIAFDSDMNMVGVGVSSLNPSLGDMVRPMNPESCNGSNMAIMNTVELVQLLIGYHVKENNYLVTRSIDESDHDHVQRSIVAIKISHANITSTVAIR
ncbi:unnamed protein product, partial [Adineta steineri]